MGYFNRKDQCRETLKSIQRSSASDQIEVIIADDGSANEHILGAPELAEFSFPIEIWRVEPEQKRWLNPAAAYNLAISKAKGDWIILQNPEVQHIGDICGFISKNSTEIGVYYAFQVFACASIEINKFVAGLSDNEIVTKIGNKIAGTWYCHPQYRQKAYHFCTAIHRDKLTAVGGFNPIMQNGIDYDDDELLTRIQRVCRVQYVRTPGVMGLHLWHPRYAYMRPDLKQLQAKNKALYLEITRNPKIVHVDTNVSDFGKDFSLIYP